MDMIWVINLNSNSCRIYQYQKSPAQVTLVKEINHPELKLKTGDTLTTDRPGHYHTSESARGAYSPHRDAKEIEIDNFAREVAKELDQKRHAHAYEQLIIIAAPHMHGLLFRHLHKQVKELVINNVEKDLLHLTDSEIVD